MSDKPDSNTEANQQVVGLKEALKQVIYQNEMMLRWVNGAVLSVDRKGNVLDANETALQSLGWELADLKGKQCHETIHHTLDDGGEYPWDFCPVFAAIEDGSAHHVDGDLFWQKNGASFMADYIVCPIRNEENEITGATLTFRNLTEQRLQEAKQIHGMKLESIGELAAGIAHEINTPIQFIGSNVTFLKEAFDDLLQLTQKYAELKEQVADQEGLKALLEQIDDLEENADLEFLVDEAPRALDQTGQGVERVAKLVLGLKGFAHSSDNENKVPADINDLIENTLVVCQNAYKYVAECETNFGEIPSVKVLHGDIGQVILNLVVNAAHAIESKRANESEMGKITISTHTAADSVVIRIGDNAGGIPENIKDRIFDPFFTTKEVGQGSGQGLAISRTIVVEKHGGEISFESKPNEGTIFEIRLPCE
ncbi:MAG: PAS domain-containing protein [Desulfobulbaceae bacterium]|nr:MAG: PAS domain-containing protein [Desulfobulbaceae bacterium]